VRSLDKVLRTAKARQAFDVFDPFNFVDVDVFDS
jgi:hypothetical protein